MADRRLLPEVGEGEAEDAVAQIYEEIRTTLRIPFVGLIYRTLAVEPGRLESAWLQLRQLFVDPATWRAASALHWQESAFPPAALAGHLGTVGLDARFFEQAATTLDAYDHANRLNLLGLSALLIPLTGAGSPEAAPSSATPQQAVAREQLLPMLEIRALATDDRALLLEISQALLPGADPVLVPSLLRHFALPGLLGRLWPTLRPAIAGGYVHAAAAALRSQAAAAPIPARNAMNTTLDPALRPTVEQFLLATSTMIVSGALIRRALLASSGG